MRFSSGEEDRQAEAVHPDPDALVEQALDVVEVVGVAGVRDLHAREVDALLLEDLDLARPRLARRPRVGHDRRPGANARARGRAVDLLDVLGDAGLVRGALDEGGLDLGALDSLLDVGHEEVGHRVGVAQEEELAAGTRRCRSRCRARPEGRLLSETSRMKLDVAAEEHRGRVGDRLDPELDRGLGGLDRGVESARRPGTGSSSTVPSVGTCGHCVRTASSVVIRCSWINVVPSSPASICPLTVSTLAIRTLLDSLAPRIYPPRPG